MFARRMMPWAWMMPCVLLLGVLAGCGGGGGSGGASNSPPSIGTTNSAPAAGSGSGTSGSAQASISANVSTLSVSASTAESAPTATISVSGQISGASTIYVGAEISNNGIASATDTGGYSANFNLVFKAPGPLGSGTYNDTIIIYGCYDQACTKQVGNSPLTIPVAYTVTLGPTQLSSISPTSTPAGGSGLTLQVDGTGFTPQSTIEWNGTPLPTQYVSPIEVDARLTASDIALADIAAITVADSAPDMGPSAPATFTVAGVSPTTVAVGSPGLTLTVIGEGFTASSTVQWNGTGMPTTYVSANELHAQIAASDIAATGTASVSLQDGGAPGPAGTGVSIVATPASKDGVAFQINPQHSGSISFNSVSLPAGAAWSVDVGGTPSYALIADGKVFVTSQSGVGAQPQSSLVALDQATGAMAWGPIPLTGPINAAYDNGAVFVSTGSQIQAYDAQTGALQWSVSAFPGTSFTSVAPANGLVYAQSNPNNGLVTAIKEDTGLIMWQQSRLGDTAVDPTVTADGVYVSGVGFTADLDAATGSILWQNYPEYSNPHDTISPLANGVLYSPDTAEVGSDNGTEFDAEAGTVLGGFNTFFVPAIDAQTGYFVAGGVAGGTLNAVDLGTGTVLWTFSGDGQLVTSPVIVNQYVFIASASGNVYGLDASNGSVVWQKNVGAAIAASAGWGQEVPTSGLSAGDGLLVVPAGTKVTAYTLSTNP